MAAGVTQLPSPIRGVMDRQRVGFFPGFGPWPFPTPPWQVFPIPAAGSLSAQGPIKAAKLAAAWFAPSHAARMARATRLPKSVSWFVSRCGSIERPDDLRP